MAGARCLPITLPTPAVMLTQLPWFPIKTCCAPSEFYKAAVDPVLSILQQSRVTPIPELCPLPPCRCSPVPAFEPSSLPHRW